MKALTLVPRLAVFATLALSASQALATPQSACREEALASSQQAIESRFEGNERLTSDLQFSSRKVESGFEAVVIGLSEDYHHGADVVPTYSTKVTIEFDQECSEVARTISKK